MTIRIFPSVVWALDDRALATVNPWYGALDSDTRRFVTLAAEEAEVREAVKEFNRVDFGDRLRDLDISLPPEGTRVHVVPVAYGMGAAAFLGWERCETWLEQLGREVTSLECHRVLLANYGEHPPRERRLHLEGTRAVPWLVSTRLNTGQELDTDAMVGCVGRLLSGLLLAEPLVTQHRRQVFDEFPQAGHVKVFGYPAIEPEFLLRRLADLMTRLVLFQAREVLSDRPSAPVETTTRVRDVVGAFTNGNYDGDRLLRAVLGLDGIGGWPLHLLLGSAGGVLRTTIDRLDHQPAAAPVAGSLPEAPQTWWRRLLAAVTRAFGYSTASKAPAIESNPTDGPSERELEYVRARLRRAKQLLESVGNAGGSLRPGCHPPPALQAEWSRHLEENLRRQLRVIATELPGEPSGSDAIIEELRTFVRGVTERHFATAVREWEVTEADIAAAVAEFRDGLPLRYTGRLIGGSLETYAVASSETVPEQPGGSQQYRYWRSEGLVLFGVSRSVPADQLAW